jgi:gamma-glutamyltranspeptidase
MDIADSTSDSSESAFQAALATPVLLGCVLVGAAGAGGGGLALIGLLGVRDFSYWSIASCAFASLDLSSHV